MPEVVMKGEWDRFAGEMWKDLTAECLLPVIRRDAALYTPLWKTRAPLGNGVFNIHFACSPRSHGRDGAHASNNHMACLPMPAELYGVKVDSRDHAYHPSSTGFIFLDTRGFPVAELVVDEGSSAGDLYVLYDMVRRGTSRELSIGRYLFQDVANFFDANESSAADQHPQLWRTQYEDSQVSALTATLAETALDGSPPSVRNWEVELKKKSAEFRQTVSELRLAALLSTAQLDFGLVQEKYRKELKRIAQNPLFADYGRRTGGSRIEFMTKPLHCTYDGKRRRIGKMRITMDLTSFRICWFNEDSLQSIDSDKASIALNAPGVGEDGEAFDKAILVKGASLLGRGQLAQAFQLGVNYIQLLNPSADWAANATLWPEAIEGENE